MPRTGGTAEADRAGGLGTATEALVEADCDVGHLLVLLDGSDDCDGGSTDDPTDTDTSDEGEVLADCDGDQARAALRRRALRSPRQRLVVAAAGWPPG